MSTTQRPARQILIDAIRQYRWVIVSAIAVFVVTAGVELWLGGRPSNPGTAS